MPDEFELKGKVRIDTSELSKLPAKAEAAAKEAQKKTGAVNKGGRPKGPEKTPEEVAEQKSRKLAYEQRWRAEKKAREAAAKGEVVSAKSTAHVVQALQEKVRTTDLDAQIKDRVKLRQAALADIAARREADLEAQIAAAKEAPTAPDRPLLKSALTSNVADKSVQASARKANDKHFEDVDPAYHDAAIARRKRSRGKTGAQPTAAEVAADPEGSLKREYVRQWRAAQKAGIAAESRSETAARMGIKLADKRIRRVDDEIVLQQRMDAADKIRSSLRPEQRPGFDRIYSIAGTSKSGKYKGYPPEFERREPEVGGNRREMEEDVGGPKGPYQPEVTVHDETGKQLYDGPNRRAIGKPTIGGRGLSPEQLSSLQKQITPEGPLSPAFVDPRLASAVVDSQKQILSASAEDEITARDIARENKKRGVVTKKLTAATTRTSNRVLSMDPHDVYMREWNAAKKAGLPRPTRTEVFARMGATTPVMASRAAARGAVAGPVTRAMAAAVVPGVAASPVVAAAVAAATTRTATAVAGAAGAAVAKAARSPRVAAAAAPTGLLARLAAAGNPAAMLAMAGMGPGGRMPAGGGGGRGGGGGGRARGYVPPPPPPPKRPFGARPTAVGGASSSLTAGAFRGFATAFSQGTGIGVPFLSLSPAFIAASVAASAFTLGIKKSFEAVEQLAGSVMKLRTVTGGSLTSAAHLAAATRLYGVESDTAAAAATNIRKKVLEGDNVFERLGVTTQDASGKIRDAGDILLEVRDRISKLRTPALQAAAAEDALGDSSEEMMRFLRQSPTAFAAQTAAITKQTKAGLAAAAAEDERVRKGSAIKNAFGGFFESIGINFVKKENEWADFFDKLGKDREANNARAAAMRKAQLANMSAAEVAAAGKTAEEVVRARQKSEEITPPSDIGVSPLTQSISILKSSASDLLDIRQNEISLMQSLLGLEQQRIQNAFSLKSAEIDIANSIFDQDQALANAAEDRAMQRAEQIAALTISLNEFRAAEFSAMVRAREQEKSFFAFRPDNALARANDERRYQRDRAQQIERNARTNALSQRQLENAKSINAFEEANATRQEAIVSSQVLLFKLTHVDTATQAKTALINLQMEILRQQSLGKRIDLNILLQSDDFSESEKSLILKYLKDAAIEALGIVRSGALREPMPGRIGGPQD